jgi:ribosomal protein S18 acetylase RimI-like enzyme
VSRVEIILSVITVEQARPIRRDVLRPGHPITAVVYPSDDHPKNFHVGASVSGQIVGVATVYPQPFPPADLSNAWQLRGMAVREQMRGRGIGKMLVRACLGHVASQGGAMLWCNARTAVVGFYQSMGFQVLSEEFHIPVSGPHYVMGCAIT